ncbi:MAG: ribosome small subunit-dependent GTPase A [Clostridium sp.]|uniref:ribosome small subunit-dependent GTPase A n=1 Tax=Clostridium sp. TaxID=1506 RepID=UPI00306DC8F0
MNKENLSIKEKLEGNINIKSEGEFKIEIVLDRKVNDKIESQIEKTTDMRIDKEVEGEIDIENYDALNKIGFNEIIEQCWISNFENYSLGRIGTQHRSLYKIITRSGEISGGVSGKLQYELINKKDYPAVGDWVAFESIGNGKCIIHGVLPRRTVICRKVPGGKSDEQVLAANVDKVFITMSLNHDFNLRRLERYINIGWDSGATPILILTKADLCDNIEEKLIEIGSVAFGIEVITVSSLTGEGVDIVENTIETGDTIVFIGSSGVGKSTLINRLLGEELQVTKEVGEHDKGRHTTTHRELFVMARGGVIIDTPGMRELQLSQGDIESTFSDVEEIAEKCYFSDCKHKSEPKCAIKEAIKNGNLSEERLRSYEKLKKELYNHDQRMKAKQLVNERKTRKGKK